MRHCYSSLSVDIHFQNAHKHYSSLQLTYTFKTRTKHFSSLQLTYTFKTRPIHPQQVPRSIVFLWPRGRFLLDALMLPGFQTPRVYLVLSCLVLRCNANNFALEKAVEVITSLHMITCSFEITVCVTVMLEFHKLTPTKASWELASLRMFRILSLQIVVHLMTYFQTRHRRWVSPIATSLSAWTAS